MNSSYDLEGERAIGELSWKKKGLWVWWIYSLKKQLTK